MQGLLTRGIILREAGKHNSHTCTIEQCHHAQRVHFKQHACKRNTTSYAEFAEYNDLNLLNSC
jgi:hypothetical protein